MTVHYTLRRNKLLDDSDAYTATVQPRGSADIEYIIREICKRETTVGEADVRGVLTEYFKIVEDLLQKGIHVRSPLVHYRNTIKGVFYQPVDKFDPSRHQLQPLVLASQRLQRALRDVGVEKLEGKGLGPCPELYVDVDSGTNNSVLTPGGMGRLAGRRLSFDPEDPLQGIFFLAGDGTGTQVATVGWNKPSMLMFTVPDLSAGEYRLEVRASVNGSEELRVGALDVPLTVGG